VRKSSHLVMTSRLECKLLWGKNKSQENMGGEVNSSREEGVSLQLNRK
jgi:hypothetical protein